MRFGAGYGIGLWFLILKGLDVEPFTEWGWWFALIPVAWQSFVEIEQFVCRQGSRALGQAVLARLFVRTLGRGTRGNQTRPPDPRPRDGQPVRFTFRGASWSTLHRRRAVPPKH